MLPTTITPTTITTTTPHRRYTRQNAPPPPFVPLGIFPLTSLPCELLLHIASYLTPRGIFALLLTSPTFSHVLYVLNPRYTREQVVYEDRLYRSYTPLQYFCSRGVEYVVKRLLETGVSPNEVTIGDSRHQLSPLIHAVGFRSAAIVSLLIQHGARVNDCDHPRRLNTPLHIAVGPPHSVPPRRRHDQEGYKIRAGELPQIVQLLLDAGAKVRTRNRNRHTPLQTACMTANANILIIKSLAAAQSDMSRRGSIMPSLSPIGDTDIQLIHYAANAGNIAIVQFLLDAGVDLEVETRAGMRPLDLAVLHMRRDVVEMLVAAGADVSAMIGVGSAPPGPLDPFEMIAPTATWEQYEEWLRLRGARPWLRSLNEWLNHGKSPGKNQRRPGQVKSLQRCR